MKQTTVLASQICQLRKKLSHQRLIISQQLYSPLTYPEPNEITFPRSMTMRWLQRRPDLALRLLTKAGSALTNGAVLKSLPLILLVLVIMRARNIKKDQG